MIIIEILKLTGEENTTALPNREIKYIVIHYTASTSSKPGTARNIAAWFGREEAQASADFIVDDETIYQYNPDISNRYCWSVGGYKYSNLSTKLGGQFYGKCTNKNSISVEICSNKINKASLDVYDNDWYYTESSLKLAIELVKYLMELYNIPADRVIMHHQVTGKLCPNPWVLNESRLDGWYKFKEKLSTFISYKVKINTNVLNIRKGPGTNYEVVDKITDKGVYTIVSTSTGAGSKLWGKLKSGVGWISLDYCNRL